MDCFGRATYDIIIMDTENTERPPQGHPCGGFSIGKEKDVITHAKEAKDPMQIPRLSRAM